MKCFTKKKKRLLVVNLKQSIDQLYRFVERDDKFYTNVQESWLTSKIGLVSFKFLF